MTNKGNSSIEFALILPFFVVCILALIVLAQKTILGNTRHYETYQEERKASFQIGLETIPPSKTDNLYAPLR